MISEINKRIRHESSIVIKFSISIIDFADTSLSFKATFNKKEMNKRYKVKYEIVNTVAEKHNIVSCKQNILLAYMYRDYVLGVFGSALKST